MNQQKQETITKQKNPLRVEQGKRLVEYNHPKMQELENLNEQITKRDNMMEHKPEEPSNNYLYISIYYIYIYIYMVEKYTKDLKESIYHAEVISALAIGFTMLGKSLIEMSPNLWVSFMLRMA